MNPTDTAGRAPEDAPTLTPFCGSDAGYLFNRHVMESVSAALSEFGLEAGVDVQTPDGHKATIVAFHVCDSEVSVLVRFRRSQGNAYYAPATLAPLDRNAASPDDLLAEENAHEDELDPAVVPPGTDAREPVEFLLPVTAPGERNLVEDDHRLRGGVAYGIDMKGEEPRYVIVEGGLEEFSAATPERLSEVLQGYLA